MHQCEHDHREGSGFVLHVISVPSPRLCRQVIPFAERCASSATTQQRGTVLRRGTS